MSEKVIQKRSVTKNTDSKKSQRPKTKIGEKTDDHREKGPFMSHKSQVKT